MRFTFSGGLDAPCVNWLNRFVLYHETSVFSAVIWRTAAISGLSAAILLAAILVVLFVYLFFDDFIFLAKLMAGSGC